MLPQIFATVSGKMVSVHRGALEYLANYAPVISLLLTLFVSFWQFVTAHGSDGV